MICFETKTHQGWTWTSQRPLASIEAWIGYRAPAARAGPVLPNPPDRHWKHHPDKAEVPKNGRSMPFLSISTHKYQISTSTNCNLTIKSCPLTYHWDNGLVGDLYLGPWNGGCNLWWTVDGMAGQHCEFFGGWNAKNTYVAEFLEISMTQTFRNPENIPRSMLRFFRLMEKNPSTTMSWKDWTIDMVGGVLRIITKNRENTGQKKHS